VFTAVTFAVLVVAIVGTSFLSGIFGMAGGMVLMGVLLAIMPVSAAMVLHGVTQMASNGWRAWLWRAHIKWPIVFRFMAGSLLAAGAFAFFAWVPSKAVALLVLGLTPVVGMHLPKPLRLNVARRFDAVAGGAVCTSLMLIAGVSGPILDVFFVQAGLDRKSIVSTKATVQTFSHLLKLVYFGTALVASGGSLSPWIMLMAVGLAVVGTNLSKRLLDRMTDVQFISWSRRIIVAISAVYLAQASWLLVTERTAAAQGTAAAVQGKSNAALQ
jgi:uncharacterized membrane protein YfcA